MSELTRGDSRPECCREEANLVLIAEERRGEAVLTTRRCQVCQRRHFEATVPPIMIGMG